MPRKQAIVNESSAAAAPARAAKPKAPRVKSAKHTKTAAGEPPAVTEMNPAIETLPGVDHKNAALDSAAVANVLQAELPVEQIETSIFVSASAPDGAPSESASVSVNGEPREEIARIAYSYWLARGCVGGDPVEDWVRAESEYRQRLS
jgi:Protein of unknown function (DUF2934)